MRMQTKQLLRTYTSKTVFPCDWLYTFFHRLRTDELGVIPNMSMLKSPFASRGIGCDNVEDGTKSGTDSASPSAYLDLRTTL